LFVSAFGRGCNSRQLHQIKNRPRGDFLLKYGYDSVGQKQASLF
jgi:hypothetical protein